MGTKQVVSAKYEHTCDGCGRVNGERYSDSSNPPPMWTSVAVPTDRLEQAQRYRVDGDANHHPMVSNLLCWGCLDSVGKYIRKMRKND